MAAGIDTDRSRIAWWGFGAVLAVALGFVVWSFIGTFVFGVFIYYATRPVYIRLKGRIRPASLAAAAALLLLALPAILLLGYTVAIGIQEFRAFARRYPVNFIGSMEQFFPVTEILLRPADLAASQDGLETLLATLSQATAYVGFIGIAALHLFVMIAIAFYLLRDDHRLSRWLHRRFSDDAGVLQAYVAAVDRSYHQIFFGNLLNAVITALIGAILYNLLNLFAPAGTAIPYPTLLGLLTGIASLIPIVGMKLVYVPATLYLLAEPLLRDAPVEVGFPILFALVSFVIVDTIPDLVLRPYVSGRNLHVGMVMFAYIFGPLLFGWYGIFLGPMVLVLIVHFVRIVLPELVAGVPLHPVAVDPSYLTDAPDAPDHSSSPDHPE